MIQLEIKDAIIPTKQLIEGINNMSEKDRFKVLEGITKMNDVIRQKWAFITSMRLLAKNDLSEGDLFALLSECDNFSKQIKKEIRKLQDAVS